VDQVSRPMQIALVAVVLLAGMWFTVLKPKPATDSSAGTPTPAASEPVAPGVKGLVNAVNKAKAVSKTSDATNAKIQSASGSAATVTGNPAAAKPAAAASKGVKSTTPSKAKTTAKATTGAAAAKAGTKTATAKAKAAAPKVTAATPAKKAAAPATDVDPSDRLLAYLAKGKTLVILFEGNGADDKAARKAVHQTAQGDPKHVVSAYVPIAQVGKYEAITSDIQVLASPTILVIGTDGKATVLTGYVDAQSVRQTVGDARREAAAAKSAAKK
jgi:hypothetical protein